MRTFSLRRAIFLAAGLLLIGLTACRERQEGEGGTTVYDQAEPASQEKPRRVLTPPQREQYLERAQARLRQMEEDLQSLQDSMSQLPEAGRTESLRDLEDLRRQKENARERFERLRESGAESWPQTQADLQQSLEFLETGIHQHPAWQAPER